VQLYVFGDHVLPKREGKEEVNKINASRSQRGDHVSLFRHILLLEKGARALDLQQPNVVVDVAVMATMAIGAPKFSRGN